MLACTLSSIVLCLGIAGAALGVVVFRRVDYPWGAKLATIFVVGGVLVAAAWLMAQTCPAATP